MRALLLSSHIYKAMQTAVNKKVLPTLYSHKEENYALDVDTGGITAFI
jgi:hypothetical protein